MAGQSFASKSDAETYARSLTERLIKSPNLSNTRFIVAPYEHDKRGKPTSWGVVRRWRYPGRPDLGERATWV